MIIAKKHINQGRLILAACDSSLLNKKIEDSNIILDLTSNFYKGEKISNEEFIGLVKKSYILNVVGKDSISLLVDEKIISKDEPKKVKDVPYVQVVFEVIN